LLIGSKYNYLIVFTDSQNKNQNQSHIDFVTPMINAAKVIHIDPNMKVTRAKRPSLKTLRLMMKKKQKYYMNNPRIFITDFLGYIKKFKK